MSLGMTLVILVAAWLAVALAMLWGVLRIARRHHPHSPARTDAIKPHPSHKERHAHAH